jgi:hypothetical protein
MRHITPEIKYSAACDLIRKYDLIRVNRQCGRLNYKNHGSGLLGLKEAFRTWDNIKAL